MKISTRGTYALRLMIDLANHKDDSFVPLKDISERQGISLKYFEQITTLLNKNGLLKSVRGPQGGYMLSKAPEDYTIGEILRATEGELVPVSCLEPDAPVCTQRKNCPTIKLWENLEKIINDYLDSVTLEQLCSNRIKSLI